MKHRINHLLPVALMLLLGAMTYWLQFAIEATPQTESASNSHEPDAIGKKVTIARMDLHGIAQYHLSAESMVHYPDDDSMELTAPRFLKKDAMAEVTVTANKGVINQETKEARFYDNVELLRKPLKVDRAAKSSPRCLQQPAQDLCDGGLKVDRAAKSSPRCLQQPAQDLCDGALPGTESLRIRTQYMQVSMENGIAQTDRPVTILNGPSTLSGTGMKYERETGHLSLLSQVKGRFHVQKN